LVSTAASRKAAEIERKADRAVAKTFRGAEKAAKLVEIFGALPPRLDTDAEVASCREALAAGIEGDADHLSSHFHSADRRVGGARVGWGKWEDGALLHAILHSDSLSPASFAGHMDALVEEAGRERVHTAAAIRDRLRTIAFAHVVSCLDARVWQLNVLDPRIQD